MPPLNISRADLLEGTQVLLDAVRAVLREEEAVARPVPLRQAPAAHTAPLKSSA
jgi:hypothetical protein